MKMTPEHFALLEAAIADKGHATNEDTRQAYRDRRIPRGDSVQDIDVRFRWDIYWNALSGDDALRDAMWEYKTAHVDTALRRIVDPL